MIKKSILSIFAAVLFVGLMSAIDLTAKDHTSTIKIKTSAQCGMCEKTIEGGLEDQKGVIKSELDADSKMVTVTYDDSKTNEDNIRKDIAEMGYDADDVKANKKAQKKLPKCCQPKSR
ncbi:MAG: heavy-metal-associated domain-containing protein [Candidatus Kapaibacterium sp.]